MIQNFKLSNHRHQSRPLLQINSTAPCARGRARTRTGRALAAPASRTVAKATGSKIVLPIFAGYRNGIIRDHLTDALKQHLPPASGTDFQACECVINKLCAKYITFSNNMQMAGAKKVHGRASPPTTNPNTLNCRRLSPSVFGYHTIRPAGHIKPLRYFSIQYSISCPPYQKTYTMKTTSFLPAFLLTLFLFSGCATKTVVVKTAPPPPKKEHRAKCGPRSVWVAGHWNWNGRRYVWTPGHCKRKKYGHTWVPGHWKKTRGGWRWIPGHWS